MCISPKIPTTIKWSIAKLITLAQAGYAYFPTTCLIAKFYDLENGAKSEVAFVGNEGMVGIALFMDGGIMLNRAVVVSAGYAYRLQGQAFARESKQNLPLLKLLLRYTPALITQLAQTAVCNRHHTIDQQLCRFILPGLDRLAGKDLMMTQELIASMLGGAAKAYRRLSENYSAWDWLLTTAAT